MRRVDTPKLFLVVTAIMLVASASTQADTNEPLSIKIPAQRPALERGESLPGVDWDRFDQIIIHPIQITYTADFKQPRGLYRDKFRPQDTERTRRYFEHSVRDHVGRHYPVTTTPGPRVLRIDAVLVNPILDRSELFGNGEEKTFDGLTLSLLVVLRDSETGEPLYHIAVPLTVGPINRQLNGAGYWNQMRLVFDRAARKIRYSLKNVTT